MQFSLAILGAIALANAAYVPSEPWTTLKPSATYSGADVDHTHLFGIQIVAIASSTSSSIAKRDVVNQIGDGQIQKQTSQTLSKPTTASVINQIGDGQIQHQTSAARTTASVINQIGDGQIQHQTAAAPTTVSVVNQIGDGQIQHQTTTASVVNQIGDGQIQHQTTTAVGTSSIVNQIGDGQIQHQTTTTATGVTQISDGQIQATSAAAAADDSTEGFPVACKTDVSLVMMLSNGELKDSHGRIGAIVANRQFQFDGPPPQAGSIYAAGWSVTPDGFLALGDSDVFYQCLSGDFYNLYDENVAAQCEPVHLSVIDLVAC